MKYKLLTAILLMALPVLASDLDYAFRLPAELQVTEAEALVDLTWQQGTTPLIQVEVLRRGRPVDADTNTTVRMIIGPSATGTYYAVAYQSTTTNTSYYIQWPTIGTNSHGTNTTAQAWWYTIYFARNGHDYWTGNGDLYIEETTSTATNGLTWQEITYPSVSWSNVTGSILDNTILTAEFATKADTNDLTAVSNAFVAADTAISNAFCAADIVVSNAFVAADLVLSGQLVTAYTAADNTLSGQLVTAYAAADNTLSGQLVTAYTAADNTLSGQLVTAYQAGDTIVSNAFVVADNTLSGQLAAAYAAADNTLSGQLVTAYSTADTGVSNAFRSADTIVSNAFVAADLVLSGQLVTAYAAADNTLSGQLVTAYSAADNTLSGQLVTAYGTADNTLSGQLVAAYSAADIVVSNAFIAADTVVSNAFVAADLVLSGELAAAWAVADNTLSGQLVTAYAAADNTLSGQLVTAYAAADNTLSGQLVAAYSAADTVVSNAFIAADTAISSAYAAADTGISNAFGTADTGISNAFRAADTVISNLVDDVEGYTNYAFTAYGWGNHADEGYLTAGTNIFQEIYVAERSQLGTNISGLTGTYTGVVAVAGISYTGVTVMVIGRTYDLGFTKQNSFGTATLSIGAFSLSRSSIGSASNYFSYKGSDTNLIINIIGTGSSKSDISAIYCRQITNGPAHISGDLDVGGVIRWDGNLVGTAATNESSDFDAAGSAAAVATNLTAVSNAVDILETNTAPLQSFLGVSNAVDIIETNYVEKTDVVYLAALTNATITESTQTQVSVTGRILDIIVRTNYQAVGSYLTATDTVYLAAITNNTLTESTSNSYAKVGRVGQFTTRTNYQAVGDYATGTPIYVESDPVFTASVAYAISASDTNSWTLALDYTNKADTAMQDFSDDTSPTAGGNLDMGGNTISNGTLAADMFPDCTNTWYVELCGNDANSGLAKDAPMLTIQAAIDAAEVVELAGGGHQKIQVGGGTWTEDNTLAKGISFFGSGLRVTKLGGSMTLATNLTGGATLENFSFLITGTTGPQYVVPDGMDDTVNISLMNVSFIYKSLTNYTGNPIKLSSANNIFDSIRLEQENPDFTVMADPSGAFLMVTNTADLSMNYFQVIMEDVNITNGNMSVIDVRGTGNVRIKSSSMDITLTNSFDGHFKGINWAAPSGEHQMINVDIDIESEDGAFGDADGCYVSDGTVRADFCSMNISGFEDNHSYHRTDNTNASLIVNFSSDTTEYYVEGADTFLDYIGSPQDGLLRTPLFQFGQNGQVYSKFPETPTLTGHDGIMYINFCETKNSVFGEDVTWNNVTDITDGGTDYRLQDSDGLIVGLTMTLTNWNEAKGDGEDKVGTGDADWVPKIANKSQFETTDNVTGIVVVAGLVIGETNVWEIMVSAKDASKDCTNMTFVVGTSTGSVATVDNVSTLVTLTNVATATEETLFCIPDPDGDAFINAMRLTVPAGDGLDDKYLRLNGLNPMTGDLNGGGQKATNFVNLVETNTTTYLSVLRSMTNYTAVASSSNYLTYDTATRLLSGCVTNSGDGSGFPLTENGNLAGYTLSNGFFVGDGDGLTNLTSYVATNAADYTGLLTNLLAFHAESNIYQRVDGTNVYYGESVTIAAGITAGTYYDGANGAAASNLAAAAYPASNPSNFVTSGDAEPLWVAASNQVQTDLDNLEGATNSLDATVAILNTNAVRLTDAAYTNTAVLAAAALPASETNALAVTDLQITGTSPTNGAVWIATNNAGQGKWSKLVAFRKTMVSDFQFTGAYNNKTLIVWDTEDFDYGDNVGVSEFTAPADGIYRFILATYWQRVAGAATFQLPAINASGAILSELPAMYDVNAAISAGFSLNDTGECYLTNGAIVSCAIGGDIATTNKIVGGIKYNYWTGVLVRELP